MSRIRQWVKQRPRLSKIGAALSLLMVLMWVGRGLAVPPEQDDCLASTMTATKTGNADIVVSGLYTTTSTCSSGDYEAFRDEDDDLYKVSGSYCCFEEPGSGYNIAQLAPTTGLVRYVGEGEVQPGVDCDDTSDSDHPGATEITGNEDDENCDNAETCFHDDDNDGYLDTTGDTIASGDLDCIDANEGTITDLAQPADCDDASAADYPGASQIIGNGDDEDCSFTEICYLDADDDGFRPDPTGNPNPPATVVSPDADCLDAYEAVSGDDTTDCDDTDGGDFPGATETVANGDDENCDNVETCYLDADNDGYRPNNGTATVLSGDTDCSDSGEALSTDDITDCNDTNAAINPGATEITGDSVDQDCTNTETCYADADNDGYRPSANPSATVVSTDADCSDANEAISTDGITDCDDTNAAINPGAIEITGDSVDQDCTNTETCYLDADNDGYRPIGNATIASTDTDCNDVNEALSTEQTGDCDDASSADNPGAPEIIGNGDDENCDNSEICYVDQDDDSYRAGTGTSTIASLDTDCADSGEALSTEQTNDCNDTNAAINPGATEITGDSVDQDCTDTETCYLDADNDGYRPIGNATIASTDTDCNDVNEALSTDMTGDCDDASSADNPSAPEIIGNGDDENCDNSEICYVDQDDDSYRAGTGTSTIASLDTDCADSGEALSTEQTNDCNDTNAAINPGATEITGDSVDQDCTGTETCYADNDNDGYRPDVTSTVLSADADCSDAYEAISTDSTNDCDEADAADNPGASEIIGNSDDDNCDGTETCYLDDDNDGYRPSANPNATVVSTDADCSDADEALSTDLTTDCDDGNVAVNPNTVEVIANGVDENCDLADTCYHDDDNDGYLDTSGDTIASADLDCNDANEGTGTDLTTDCDDASPADYPGAVEMVANGDDEDCDGFETCYVDNDNDGYRYEFFPDVTVLSSDTDCNDAGEALSTDLITDCDDADSGDNPAATEIISNGDDEDCDGFETCYQDIDNDGYRTSLSTVGTDTDCSDSGEALSTDSTGDCDDFDANDNPGATEIVGNGDNDNCDGTETCYLDADNDGYLDSTGDTRESTDTDCNDANEGTNTDPPGDCNDALSNIYPGALETPGNGVDEDCDGFEGCYHDDDNDGYLDTTGDTIASVDTDCTDANEGTTTDLTTDCDDADDRDYPGATETVANGDDEDCDNSEICYLDSDNDGFRDTTGATRVSADPDCTDANEALSTVPTTDCDDASATDYPGATEIIGNGDDEDCDGFEACYRDNDSDNYRTFLSTVGTDTDCSDSGEALSTVPTTDCNDALSNIYPGATETVDNGVDEDCSGGDTCYEDADNDGYRPRDNPTATVVSSDLNCTDANEGQISDPTTDCNDALSNIYPGATETVDNGVDEDCSGGDTCYEDADNDGYRPSANPNAIVVSSDLDCTDATEALSTDPTTDCNDALSNIYPGAPETTDNGVDEDCSGGDTCYLDADNDGYRPNPTATVVSSDLNCTDANEALSTDPTTDCNDALFDINPSVTDTLSNGVDEDCDGNETCYQDDDDDGYLDTTGDTVQSTTDLDCTDANEGTPTDPTTDCDDARSNIYPSAPETTDNGVDEDCDSGDTCYHDDDNDGYLDSTGDTFVDTIGDCTALDCDLDCDDDYEGKSTDDTNDCDDTDHLTWPGAPEIVGNENDESCDGGETCFLDSDNDGYVPSIGESPDTISSVDSLCTEANEGTATNAAEAPDCDDSDPDTFPGAAEIEDDEVNGGIDRCMRDGDLDGWGDDEATGDIIPGTDCDDNDALTRPRSDDAEFERETRDRLTLDSDGDGTVDVDERPAEIDYNGNGIHDYREVLTDIDPFDCYTDMDLDGYADTSPSDAGAAVGSDCEDDPTSGGVQINPGEDEVCEATGTQLDTDCDGSSNTDWDGNGQQLGQLPLYRDADDDGYGIMDGTLENGGKTFGCSAGDGWSTLPIDCDDTLPQVNPSAEESCNETDDNCNGIVDDPINGDPVGCSLLYFDYDEDGYGDVDFPTCLCDTEESLGVGSEIYDQQTYVSVNTDCDDFDPAIHPVLPDCEDGQDNDNSGEEDLLDPDCGDCGLAGCFEDGREYNVERIDGSDDDCDRDILAIEMDCDDDGAMPAGALRISEEDRGEIKTVMQPADLGLMPCMDPNATKEITCWDGEDIQLSCAVESGFWVFNYTTSDDGWVGRFVGGRREYPAGTSDDAQISFDCDDTCALRYGGADEICDGVDNDCSSFRGADTNQDGLPNALDKYAGLVEADREGTVTESELDIDQDGFLSCTDFDPDGTQLWPSTRSCSDQVVDTTLLEDCNDQCALVYPGMEPACDGFSTVCDAELLGVDEDRDGHQTCGAWTTEETDEHIYMLAVLIGEVEIGDTGDTGDTADSSPGPTEFVPLLLPRRRVPQNADTGNTVPIWYGDDLKEGDQPEIEPCDQGLYDALHAVFAGSEADGVNPVDRAIAANDPIYLSEVCAVSTTITCGLIRVDLISTADEHLWEESADTRYSVEWARELGVITEECAEQSDELITRSIWPAGRIREARRAVTQWECYRLYGKPCENVQPQSNLTIPVPDTVGFTTALEADTRWWKEITRFNPTEVVSGTLRECWGDPQAVSTITLSDVGGDCADGNSGASRDEPEGPGDLMGIYNGDPAECSACLDAIDNNCDGQMDCDDPSCAPCFVGHGLGCAAEGSPCQGAGCEAIPTDPIHQSTLFAGLGVLAMAAIRRFGRQSGRQSGSKVRG